MIAYVGQTRSRALIARLTELGIGEITQRGEGLPRRFPWVLDCGAYKDWVHGQPFDAEAFASSCALAEGARVRPEWCVCPDRVAGGLDSLGYSLGWLDSHGRDFPGLRWYLAVQDGMDPADVAPHVPRFSGLFVGGTLPWKLQQGRTWVQFAHEMSLRCHIGRVGTSRRVAWAKRIGADSIDSCLPLWSRGNLDRFVRALDAEPELEFGPEWQA